ncbi:ABC transporter ATP-binding protein [Robertmurraya kyonggiensis]|uniref:ABC transporter ATP-binding protein n=1 Tax=Robertmurraya kyonggiensis TaxID=1037680 RepID=UPI001882A4C7|nr:ABC transporter A family member [Robertmurraya kyonggiensis]
MTTAIAINALTKKYGTKTVVDNISFTIKEGELFGLLGVNGAGKTTLIKMLSGLTMPTTGDATLLGKSVTQSPEQVRQVIAVSPQETAIASNLTVRENLELLAGIQGFNKEEGKRKADEMISQFSLQPFEKQRAKTLSGGWQRKLSIAIALISEPQILFLDEPTLGLDILGRRELWAQIEKLKEKTTIILTTHYLEEAEELSDRICIMKNGQMKALGTAQELIKTSKKTSFEDAFVHFVTEGDVQ